MSEDDTAARRQAAAERTAEAKRLYETTDLTQVEIARRLGLYPSSVNRTARKHGWSRPVETERRQALARNVRAKVDAEIEKAERAFDGGGQATEADRTARTLASLLRTLRELHKYDQERARSAPAGGADDVYDVDEFRDTLADRLDRLRRERNAG